MAITTNTVEIVWCQAMVVPHYDPRVWRKDQCGAWINRYEYGNRNSPYGWEIDHITPVALGGSDVLSNLRPLQWKNNASRQAVRLVCSVISVGNLNMVTY
ncbi:hypothetical protein BV378_11705 [Nostoc sp. RF31YmG]|nr:hypothetical protein BV378_11705 [Nostoc sp. RF31YmG]